MKSGIKFIAIGEQINNTKTSANIATFEGHELLFSENIPTFFYSKQFDYYDWRHFLQVALYCISEIPELAGHVNHAYWHDRYLYECESKDGRVYTLGRQGMDIGRPFLRVYSEPGRTDCFLSSLNNNASNNYISLLSTDEYYAYHKRMHLLFNRNSSSFDQVRLQLGTPLGSLQYPFLMRKQEPYEEEFILVMEKLQVCSIHALFDSTCSVCNFLLYRPVEFQCYSKCLSHSFRVF